METSFFLSVLMLTCFVMARDTKCESIIYYVKPTDSESTKCPGDPCETLEYYIIEQSKSKDIVHITDNVTMILLGGYHIVSENLKTVDFGSEFVGNTLYVKGIGGPDDHTVIYGLSSTLLAHNVYLEGFLASSTNLLVSNVDYYQLRTVIVQNCIFHESSLTLTNTILSVEDSAFIESKSTAVSLYSSTANFYGYVRFVRNKGYLGGALALIGTTMNIFRNATLYFRDNHAHESGGAIYVVNSERIVNIHGYISPCFYQLMDYDEDAEYSVQLVNHSATKGGDHIYGASLNSSCIASSGCTCLYSYQVLFIYFQFVPELDSTFSAISAKPTRVCACGDNDQPQCDTLIIDIHVHPGSQFTLPTVLVGGDYGTTVGTVYAAFLQNDNSSLAHLGSSNEYHQVITKNSECSMLTFSVFSNNSQETLVLTAEESIATYRPVEDYFNEAVNNDFYDYDYITTAWRNTPIFINITLLPCPPGFVLSGDPSGCHCYPVLTRNGVNCTIKNLKGYHIWNSKYVWINVNDKSEVLFSKHCPYDYCKQGEKYVDLKSNPDDQCRHNRAGILCGKCKEGYSLAIGSSHCIHCPNNNNLALLMFFAAAGVLLVLAIAALNFTVTQGMINSLVFYASIIWAYESILFQSNSEKALTAHKTFIAWLNLDFGIESCFISGMDGFTKNGLQFIFPFYTASLFFVGIRYSSKLSKIFGSRSVPTLATLLFLSYSKLLRTTIACLQVVRYYTYPATRDEGSSKFVWATDGNLPFGQYPHIFFILAAIACLLLLWVPYTFLLFSMQWLRRVDHHRPLKFIARFKPVYDAYFAPLKDKHHYWLGVLLFVQGSLLFISSLTLNSFPSFNIVLLLSTSIFLLCYTIGIRPYKKTSILLLESSIYINLVILTVGRLYLSNNLFGKTIILSVSTTAVFLEFCVIVIWNIIPQKIKRCPRRRTATSDSEDRLQLNEVFAVQQDSDEEDEHYVRYRDSILEQSSTAYDDKCSSTHKTPK